MDRKENYDKNGDYAIPDYTRVQYKGNLHKCRKENPALECPLDLRGVTFEIETTVRRVFAFQVDGTPNLHANDSPEDRGEYDNYAVPGTSKIVSNAVFCATCETRICRFDKMFPQSLKDELLGKGDES